MKSLKIALFLLPFMLLIGCKTSQVQDQPVTSQDSFTIAFGSCNKHTVKNELWDDVLATEPDVWIWGGDIIYADTDDTTEIARMFSIQNEIPGYKALRDRVQVIGTWDDHDYGLNDGGVEFTSKAASQKVFLDFMDVAADSPRRSREGVYASYMYDLPAGSVKILVLDTRYFRSALTPASDKKKRYQPGTYGEGTVLGETQWAWLEEELRNSKAEFNILVSSIQFLSNEHGFETWGNFPHEVDKLNSIVKESGATGVIILSGDRHISEFSQIILPGVSYPLIDFTSSGLTHVYSSYSGEPNPYRKGEVIAEKSFGLLHLNLTNREVQMQMIGDQGKVLNALTQQY
ncbi:MAG: alkaline phosphatase family protein [Eudoraea sp.]|nr:alkaline phosphatase family protein [Eudoraea sp.]